MVTDLVLAICDLPADSAELPVDSAEPPIPPDQCPPAPSVKTDICYEILVRPSSVGFEIKVRYALPVVPVVCSVRFNHTGSHFALAARRSLYLFATRDGSLVLTLALPPFTQPDNEPVRSICFSPDGQSSGQYLAVSGPGYNVTVIELATYAFRQLEQHTGFVMSIIFLSDGTKMLSGGGDGKLCIWNVPDFSVARKIEHRSPQSKGWEGMIAALALCGDGCVAVGFMDGKVTIYDAQFSPRTSHFVAHGQPLLNMVSAPDGIATSSWDKTAKLWKVRGADSCTCQMSGHDDAVVAIAIPPNDGSITFTDSKDETIGVWSTKTRKQLLTLRAHKSTVFAIDAHPTERLIVSCSGDWLVCVWEYVSL
jgi:WD40 repeat protein